MAQVVTHNNGSSTGGKKLLPAQSGPVGEIKPNAVVNQTPAHIDANAKALGLQPRGKDPANGLGTYIDPVTGKQRILSHPNDPKGAHAHVNNPDEQRIDANGDVVEPESKAAHLPINTTR
jgi:hypothetical protein